MHLLLCASVAAALVGAIDLNELLRRHEETLSQIRSIKAKIELRVSEDGGKTWKPIVEYSVARNGENERFSTSSHNSFTDGKIVSSVVFKDYLTTPEGQRMILYAGLSPEETPSGTIDVAELESTGKRITAEIGPPQPFGPSGYKSAWLGTVWLAVDVGLTLREFCAGSAPVPVSGKNARGEARYNLSVTNRSGVKRIMSFDPSHNYLMTELKVLNPKGKIFEWFADMSVVEFQEPRPGIFLPKIIRGVSPTTAGRIYEVVMSDVVLNEPFDDDNLHHMEFPPGIVVADNTQEPCFHLWGDGKPVRTFRTVAELRRWKLDGMAAFARKARQGGWGGKVAWIAVATVALIGVFWLRRALLRRQGTAFSS